MHRFRPHLNHATAVAYLALFVALGGGAYAATQLPANSVGTKQLKNGAVTHAKLRHGSLSASSSTSPPFTETLPSRKTLRGTWEVEGYVEGTGFYHLASGAISFGHKLAKAPAAHVIPQDGPSTARCPGTVKAPSAARGQLCLYTSFQSNATLYLSDTTVPTGAGATRFGVGLQAVPVTRTEEQFYGARGTWAVKAK
jgi:hypothetical protein